MNGIVRAAARYWYMPLILLGIVAMQILFGFGGNAQEAVTQVSSVTPSLRPTFTPTFPATFTPTPTLTPSVTSTPVLVAPTVDLPLSPTPGQSVTIPAFFSTPVPLPRSTVEMVQSISPLATPGAVQPNPRATVIASSSLTLTATNPAPFTPTISPTLQPTATALNPTPDALASRTITVPILMYHYLSVPPPNSDIYRLDLSVSPEQFDSHLTLLKEAGFETISLRQLAVALAKGAPLPAKPVIITFDDGYRDNYDNAFPLLKKYGYTATFFVFTQVIDEYNVDYLTWEMVREMHQAGMEFGSHSYRHPDLRGRDQEFLVYEIVGSKEAIEERIGEPIRFFAYPAGRYDAATIEVLKSADFWGAVTTQWGADHTYAGRYELQRLRIRGNDSSEVVAAKLRLVE